MTQSNKFQCSVEHLHHFQCNECNKWWSIGDAPDRDNWFCPWCGTRLFKNGTCIWKVDSDGTYETSCGQSLVFTNGENDVKFCPYCGKPTESIFKAQIGTTPLRDIDEQRVNENLILAAPDLYEALDILLPFDWRDGIMDHMPGVKRARLALLKAKGVQEEKGK